MPRKKIEYPRQGIIRKTGTPVTVLGEFNPGTPCYEVRLENGNKVLYQTDAIKVGKREPA